MGKYQKKRKSTAKLWTAVIVLLAVLAVVLAAALLLPRLGRGEDPDPQQGATDAPQSAETGSPQEATVSQQGQPGEAGTPEGTQSTVTGQQEQTPPAATSEPVETTVPPAGDVRIKTSYADLYFPEKWRANLKTQVFETEETGCTVEFYGVSGLREEWLFSISFGGGEGDAVGTYKTDKGYTLDVTADISGFIPDDSWSAEDAEIICGMQEEINFVLEKLGQESGFTPA